MVRVISDNEKQVCFLPSNVNYVVITALFSPFTLERHIPRKRKKKPWAVIWITAKSVSNGQMNRSVNGQAHRQSCIWAERQMNTWIKHIASKQFNTQ